MGRVCAQPGCPEIAVDRTHCEAHKRVREAKERGWAQRKYDRTRPSRHKRGYGSKWDKARKEYLTDHSACQCDNPQCDHPPGSCKQASTDVDHVKPFKKDGASDWKLFWDKGNWMAMCHPCHSRKTRRESRQRVRG